MSIFQAFMVSQETSQGNLLKLLELYFYQPF